MQKIMVDMDDVICDNTFLTLVNKFLGTDYKIDYFKSYYIQDIIPKDRYEEWKEFFNENNVYDYAKIIDNSYEILKKLSEKYEIYIVTAYIFKDNEKYTGNNLKNKFEWLLENFQFIPPQNYIFTTNKEIINCQIKIDDRIENLQGKADKKILFTSYHNKNISEEELNKKGIIRANNWQEIEKILLKD